LNRGEFVQQSAGAIAALALPRWARVAASPDPAVAVLAHELNGDVVTPHGTNYATARALWDERFDSLRPRAVAYCVDAADVQRVVNWGRRYGVHVVPRSGGCSYAGYSSGNGVVIADVSRLAHVQHSGGRATIGAGARMIQVYAGLWTGHVTIPGGSGPSVGIAGLALGGGHGYSSRKLGTASDNLRQVQIVTADGRLLTCDSSHHSDLFWACRGGGGGNFGIVTELDFATHPVSTVSRYEIEWPWSQAEQALATWQGFAPYARDELFSVLDLIATDPSGKNARSHVVSAGQFFGSQSDLEALIQPLASTGTPTKVFTTTVSYYDAVLHWAGCSEAGAPCLNIPSAFKGKSDYVTKPLPAEAIHRLVAGITARQGQGRGAIYLDSYGGAINRVAPGATAFVHRNALFSVQYTAQWSGSSSQSLNWIDGLYAQMRPYVSGFAYQNYIDPALQSWQHAYYGSNLARLKAVKRKYDPRNAFHFRQSIPPK